MAKTATKWAKSALTPTLTVYRAGRWSASKWGAWWRLKNMETGWEDGYSTLREAKAVAESSGIDYEW